MRTVALQSVSRLPNRFASYTHTFKGPRNRTLEESVKLFGTINFSIYFMANSAGASRVNQLVQLAKATFSQSKHEPGFTEHLEKLKKFVSTCTSTKQIA